MKKSKLYIAYGSNLNLEQMAHRCPTATVLGTSEIKDYELVFRGSKTGSYATIEPQEGGIVPVLIWEIEPKDEKSLDKYEGYPNFYGKENMNLIIDGQRIPAIVYIMPDTHVLGMPTDSYVNSIAKGYESAEFDINILYSAVEKTQQRMEQEPPTQGNMFEMRGW